MVCSIDLLQAPPRVQLPPSHSLPPLCVLNSYLCEFKSPRSVHLLEAFIAFAFAPPLKRTTVVQPGGRPSGYTTPVHFVVNKHHKFTKRGP